MSTNFTPEQGYITDESKFPIFLTLIDGNPTIEVVESDWNRVSEYEKTHKVADRVSDPRWGDVTIYEGPKDSPKVVMKERITNSKNVAKTYILDAKHRISK